MCFNPVLGFLSVSTIYNFSNRTGSTAFQSRAGFSECLDLTQILREYAAYKFQSRAGFSECLDSMRFGLSSTRIRFNPVLGFLSVSTCRKPVVIES